MLVHDLAIRGGEAAVEKLWAAPGCRRDVLKAKTLWVDGQSHYKNTVTKYQSWSRTSFNLDIVSTADVLLLDVSCNLNKLLIQTSLFTGVQWAEGSDRGSLHGLFSGFQEVSAPPAFILRWLGETPVLVICRP